MVRAYSSVVEHYVDIVGVASSILATPTIGPNRKSPAASGGFFVRRARSITTCKPKAGALLASIASSAKARATSYSAYRRSHTARADG